MKLHGHLITDGVISMWTCHDPRCQGPVKAAEMFKVLLKDARSRDVIQSSFVALIQEGVIVRLYIHSESFCVYITLVCFCCFIVWTLLFNYNSFSSSGWEDGFRISQVGQITSNSFCLEPKTMKHEGLSPKSHNPSVKIKVKLVPIFTSVFSPNCPLMIGKLGDFRTECRLK